MKKLLIVLIVQVYFTGLSFGQDPTFTNPNVNPSPTSTLLNATRICVDFYNNSTTAVPYNSFDPVILTISTDQLTFDMDTLPIAPNVTWFNWSVNCINNCSDPQLVTYTIRGVQNQIIPGKQSPLESIGGSICVTGTASQTANSTPTSGVGFNANITASAVNDISRESTSNQQSTYTYTTPLPIKLIDFSVTKFDDAALLKWRTAQAENFSHFEIERAGQDKVFEKIGEVIYNAVEDRSSERDFSFVDLSPKKGDNYYRLKLMDLDNSFEFSAIRHFNSEKDFIQLYPNPIMRGQDITLNSSEALGPIQIINSNGKKNYKLSQTAEKLTLSTNDFPSGVYFRKSSQKIGVMKFVVLE